jgi:hypothetical protein
VAVASAVVGDLAVVADEDRTVTIWDMTNTAAPTVTHVMTMVHGAWDVVGEDDAAIVAGSFDGIATVDLSVVTAPVVSSVLTAPVGVSWDIGRGMAIKDGWVYVPTAGEGVVVIDARNPAALQYAGQFGPDVAVSVAVNDDGVVVSSGDTLDFYTTDVVTAPVLVARLKGPG